MANTQNDYHVGNSKWSDETRSDVVLEPKSSVLNLPPIIVETQHTVNQLFMKRAVNYCLQAFKRYKVDPIILIVCVNTLHSYVVQSTMASRFPDGYVDCIILSKESLGVGNIDTPLNSLIALGLLFTCRALSIVNAHFC
ncbi:hypothetical protein EDC96DRAFT_504996 [Choanephora cucurbitarum]|nr:hypothetical protein EDC96DRAFT_504996 [Choanephora cucurbitarum]